ncbi:MAG: PHP domain-containing protein [Chloroflexi bacterium]|nr:PHP domain-containing protein [Chloroflexota bacterium]
MLKADFHIHTRYSLDCDTPLEQIVSRCVELGINCIAIADHGTVEGALEMQKLAPFTVIVAEEVLTPYGEIMGMFLTETVPSRIPIEEAIARIRAQGGLVGVPHPYDTVRGSALGSPMIEKVADKLDFVEVFNARSPFLRSSARAKTFAQRYSLRCTAGSDAHTPSEIGHAYVEMPEFKGRDDFLQALEQGKVYGHRTNPLAHINSTWAKFKSFLSSLT